MKDKDSYKDILIRMICRKDSGMKPEQLTNMLIEQLEMKLDHVIRNKRLEGERGYGYADND